MYDGLMKQQTRCRHMCGGGGRHVSWVTCGRLQSKTRRGNTRTRLRNTRIYVAVDRADELITMVTNTATAPGGMSFWETFLPAFSGIKPSEAALITSALLAASSVVMNFYSGISLENKKAELAIELERERQREKQLRELQGVIARYRGPLLESAIDLEQRLWHVISDRCFDAGDEEHMELEIKYFAFCMAQFLGFVEVVRREGPREISFLQQGNPQGSDTLFIMVEAIRFVLCASPNYLDSWYKQGPNRNHPGARKRRTREEVILTNKQRAACATECPLDPEDIKLRISRGYQRAIGTLMITTPMGASRHYTVSYGDFHARIEQEPSFRYWFEEIERDISSLCRGQPWQGESPFPLNRWTRVLLLQQLLIELMDLLDPDCNRIPLSDRRRRLMPVKYGSLPNVKEYQKRLLELTAGSSLLPRIPMSDDESSVIESFDGDSIVEHELHRQKRLEGLQELIE